MSNAFAAKPGCSVPAVDAIVPADYAVSDCGAPQAPTAPIELELNNGPGQFDFLPGTSKRTQEGCIIGFLVVGIITDVARNDGPPSTHQYKARDCHGCLSITDWTTPINAFQRPDLVACDPAAVNDKCLLGYWCDTKVMVVWEKMPVGSGGVSSPGGIAVAIWDCSVSEGLNPVVKGAVNKLQLGDGSECCSYPDATFHKPGHVWYTESTVAAGKLTEVGRVWTLMVSRENTGGTPIETVDPAVGIIFKDSFSASATTSTPGLVGVTHHLAGENIAGSYTSCPGENAVLNSYVSLLDISKYGLFTFPVQLTQYGGSAGTVSTGCSFTYTMKDMNGYAIAGTYSVGCRIFTKGTTTAATLGLAYISRSGVYHLLFTNEKPNVVVVPNAISGLQITGSNIEGLQQDILVLDTTAAAWNVVLPGNTCPDALVPAAW